MIYEYALTIPKNTPQETPVFGVIPIHPGIIKQVEVVFPPGPCGLAHIQLYLWERQVWPSNPNSSFMGDDVHILETEELEIIDPPFEIVILGWNDDDTYPHTPIVRVNLIPAASDLRTVLLTLLPQSTGPGPRLEG